MQAETYSLFSIAVLVFLWADTLLNISIGSYFIIYKFLGSFVYSKSKLLL